MVILRSWPQPERSCLRQAAPAIFLALIAFAGMGCIGEEPRGGEPTPVVPVKPDPPRRDEGTRRFEQFLDIAFGKVLVARDFHCVLFRTEMVGDALKPEEEIDFYDRFEPQSLRLEWIVILLIFIAYILYADRKIWAAVQLRRGPNVVGPWGIWQSFADMLKFWCSFCIVRMNRCGAMT